MNQLRIPRVNSIKIDCHELPNRPSSFETHKILRDQLGLTEDTLYSVEYDSYGRQIYAKVVSELVLEKTIAKCGGVIKYPMNDQIYTLTVENASDENVSLVISTVPYEILDHQIFAFMSEYGVVKRVTKGKYSDQHIFKNLYNGRRIVLLKRNQKTIPVYANLHGHKVQIFFSGAQRQCNICGSNQHYGFQCIGQTGETAVLNHSEKETENQIEQPLKLNFKELPIQGQNRVRQTGEGRKTEDSLQVDRLSTTQGQQHESVEEEESGGGNNRDTSQVTIPETTDTEKCIPNKVSDVPVGSSSESTVLAESVDDSKDKHIKEDELLDESIDTEKVVNSEDKEAHSSSCESEYASSINSVNNVGTTSQKRTKNKYKISSTKGKKQKKRNSINISDIKKGANTRAQSRVQSQK